MADHACETFALFIIIRDILWRSVKWAQIPATRGPTNLILQNGKRPDGSTLIPWSQGKPMPLRCHCSRHLCRITHWRHCHRDRCSSEPGSGQQNRQIWWTGRYAHILPGCHRNRRYLENCWACPGNWQTGHINPWRPQRIHLSVSAVVNRSPTGEMLSLSSTLLTTIRRRCSHTLLVQC